MNERHKNCSLDTDYLCLNSPPASADVRWFGSTIRTAVHVGKYGQTHALLAR